MPICAWGPPTARSRVGPVASVGRLALGGSARSAPTSTQIHSLMNFSFGTLGHSGECRA